MPKKAHWMLLTTDRGGMVRVNVHDVVKDRSGEEQIAASNDIDIPLDDFSRTEQEVLLDAFSIVAGHAGATQLEIQPVEEHEAPPVPAESTPRARATVKRAPARKRPAKKVAKTSARRRR